MSIRTIERFFDLGATETTIALIDISFQKNMSMIDLSGTPFARVNQSFKTVSFFIAQGDDVSLDRNTFVEYGPYILEKPSLYF